jgi:hypothetical protein
LRSKRPEGRTKIDVTGSRGFEVSRGYARAPGYPELCLWRRRCGDLFYAAPATFAASLAADCVSDDSEAPNRFPAAASCGN